MVESTHPLPMQYFKHGWWWSHYICKTCKRTSLKNKYISVLHAIVFIQITSIYDWVPRRFNEPINSLSWFSLTSMAILSATSRKTMNLDVLCFGSVVPEVQLLYIYIIFIGCSQLALLSVSWMHNTRHQWSIFYHQLCQPQKLSPQFSSTSSSSKHWAMPLQWNASLFADEMSARQPENHKALEWSSDPKRKKQRSDVVSYDVCEPTNSKNNLFVDPRFHKHIRS